MKNNSKFILFISIIIALLFFTLLSNYNTSLSNINKIILKNINEQQLKLIEVTFQERIQALNRMAARYPRTGEIEWKKDAKEYYQHFKNFQAIEWANDKGIIKKIYPSEGNEKALNLDLNSEENRSKALENAKKNKSTYFTKPIDLKQAGKGILSFHPVIEKDQVTGYIVGVYKLDQLFAKLLNQNLLYKLELEKTIVINELTSDSKELSGRSVLSLPGLHVSLRSSLNKQHLHGEFEELINVIESLNIHKYLVPVLGIFFILLIFYIIFHSFKKIGSAQKKVEDKSAYLEIIQNNAGLAMITTTLEGVITTFNPAAEKLIGYEAQELVNKETPAVFHDLDEVVKRSSEFSDKLNRQIEPGFNTFVCHCEDGLLNNFEWIYVHKNGTKFPVSLTISSLKNSDGNTIGYVGIAEDLTEKKQLNADRIKRENLSKAVSKLRGAYLNYHNDYKKLYDSILQTFLDFTQSEYGFIGEILLTKDKVPYLKTKAITNIAWNDETRKFYAENAPGGMDFMNLKTLFGWVIDKKEVLITNSAPFDKRAAGVPDGHPALNKFCGIPIFNVNNEMTAMFGMANASEGYSQDMLDEIKPMLDACSDIINLCISSDIAKAKEEQLEQERLKLIQSSKLATLGEMAAGVAHEINNPLAIISGCSSIIAKENTSQNAKENNVIKIKRSIQRITKIVNGLRKFSRTTDEANIEEVSMKKLISESIELTLAKSKRHLVPVKSIIKKDINLIIDEIQIEQIIVNLIGNAIDENSGKDNAWVEIDSRQTEKYEQIIIRDSGKGIEENILEKLFNPFFTTKAVGKGTGLGLSISKGIAIEHGGELEYEFINGHTSFVLSIPKNKRIHDAA